jgi:2-amino-4-hydroxy-6-hydroxymethyldihydropteridine diphosphokinase
MGSTLVWLGLGANLGDRAANLRAALGALAEIGTVEAVSSTYETEPFGLSEQPRFLNAVCLFRTERGPLALLDQLKAIEWRLGRRPTVRNGPRPIDLDILLYDRLLIDALRLTVPHPGMLQRSTVLVPLAELVPELVHPVTGRSIAAHLADLGPTPDVALFPPGLPPKR